MATQTAKLQRLRGVLACVSSISMVVVCAATFIVATPGVLAESVSPQRATRAARAFLDAKRAIELVRSGPTDSAVANSAAAGVPEEAAVAWPINDPEGAVLAYVVPMVPEGFVIVAAETDLKPILGYSSRGSFPLEDSHENALLHLVQWDVTARLNAYGVLDAESREAVAANRSSWNRLESIPASLLEVSELQTQWGPWLTTNWHQGGHFNSRCPYVDPDAPGARRPVGCVATAMAQIVNYWQYPNRLHFDDANWPNGDRYPSKAWPGIDIDGEAAAYDFPAFFVLNGVLAVINYDGDDDEEAYLCFAAGVKLHMSYGVSGSGAQTSDVDEVLKDHFSYGSAQSDSDRSGIWSQHRDDVIGNIKEGWPVQLGLRNTDGWGGHSVVLDGYQESSGFFHINLGWIGTSEDTWYDLPDVSSYDVVHTVVYDIAPYYAWHQVGADERNSYRSPYAGPTQAPERKWEVTVPDNLSNYRFGHLVVGSAGRVYGAIGPDDLGQGNNPYVCVIHPHGYIEKQIQIRDSDHDIDYVTQNYRGEVFFGTSEYATKTSIYRVDTEAEEATCIFDHTSPDRGKLDRAIKVDHDDYLYFVITPIFAGNSARLYCLTRTGEIHWSHTFPSQMQFYRSMPAIDEGRNHVYLNYYDSSTRKSYVVCLSRSYDHVEWTHEFPGTHSVPAMAGPPALGADGTLYVGSYTTLYALSPEDGAQLWAQDFYPAYTYQTPAIGPDGTLYVGYGKTVGSTWHPGFVRAIDPADGGIRWERELTPALGEYDHTGELYATRNGMVCVSYDRDGAARTAGLVDYGTWGDVVWDVDCGGILAFGPSETMFVIPQQQDASIYALSVGDRGDPDGLGMDFTNNEPPARPSVTAPSDGATDKSTGLTLSWLGSDPEGQDLTYDVFVCALAEDQEAAFIPVATGISTSSYTLSGLDAGSDYLWMVTATDGQAVAESPVWSFSTAPPLDSDGDGVPDGQDECPNTPAGEAVNVDGCSCSQRDDDGDGVNNCDDECPGTPSGTEVGSDGCPVPDDDDDDEIVIVSLSRIDFGTITKGESSTIQKRLTFQFAGAGGQWSLRFPFWVTIDGEGSIGLKVNYGEEISVWVGLFTKNLPVGVYNDEIIIFLGGVQLRRIPVTISVVAAEEVDNSGDTGDGGGGGEEDDGSGQDEVPVLLGGICPIASLLSLSLMAIGLMRYRNHKQQRSSCKEAGCEPESRWRN